MARGLGSSSKTKAKGAFVNDNGNRYLRPRVSVGFERKMFDRLANEAARRKIPFGRLVRELVKAGMNHG